MVRYHLWISHPASPKQPTTRRSQATTPARQGPTTNQASSKTQKRISPSSQSSVNTFTNHIAYIQPGATIQVNQSIHNDAHINQESRSLFDHSPMRTQKAARLDKDGDSDSDMDDDTFMAHASSVEESAMMTNALARFPFSSAQLRKQVTESILAKKPCPTPATPEGLGELVLRHLGTLRQASRKNPLTVQAMRGICANNLNKLFEWALSLSIAEEVLARMNKYWIQMCDDEVDVLDRYPALREGWFIELTDQCMASTHPRAQSLGKQSHSVQPPAAKQGMVPEDFNEIAAVFRPDEHIVMARTLLVAGLASTDGGHAGTFKAQTIRDLLDHLGLQAKGEIDDILLDDANWSAKENFNDRQLLTVPLAAEVGFSESEVQGSLPLITAGWSNLTRSAISKSGAEIKLGCAFICAQPWTGQAKPTLAERMLVVTYQPLAHDEAILRIQLGVVRAAVHKAWQTIDPSTAPPIDLVPCPINFFVQNRRDWHSSMGLKVFLKPPSGADGNAMVSALRVELGLRPPFVMYQVHLGGME